MINNIRNYRFITNVFFIWIFTRLFHLDASEIFIKSNESYRVYGVETNFLSGGIYSSSRTNVILLPDKTQLREASFTITNSSPKNIFFYLPQKVEQHLSIDLLDKSGVAIPKTDKGNSFGQPFNLPLNTLARHWKHKKLSVLLIPPIADCDYSFWPKFDLTKCPFECFKLKESGNYKLTVTQRGYIIDTNGLTLKPLTLPPVCWDVCVEKRP